MPYLRAIYKDYQHCCDDFIRGIELLEQRAILEATDCFQQACFAALSLDPLKHKYISYHGFSRVLQGDELGVNLCRQSVKCDCVDGDMYLNLARVEWFYQNRQKTIFALEQGRRHDLMHEGLILMQEQLGIRRRKAVVFLPRSHVVNQRIGKLMRR